MHRHLLPLLLAAGMAVSCAQQPAGQADAPTPAPQASWADTTVPTQQPEVGGTSDAAPSGADTADTEQGAGTQAASSAPSDTAATSAPPTDELPQPDPTPLVTPASDRGDIAQLQRNLRLAGFADLDIDGDWGSATDSAVIAFRARSNLAATATWDRAADAAMSDIVVAQQHALPAAVTITLAAQQLAVHNSAGDTIAAFPISSGAPGNDTPTGTFHVYQRQRVGSDKTGTVNMDYFTVFNGDIGLHGIPWAGDRSNRLWTPLGETPVSHGCIRMEDSAAKWLFDLLPDGATVTVL